MLLVIPLSASASASSAEAAAAAAEGAREARGRSPRRFWRNTPDDAGEWREDSREQVSWTGGSEAAFGDEENTQELELISRSIPTGTKARTMRTQSDSMAVRMGKIKPRRRLPWGKAARAGPRSADGAGWFAPDAAERRWGDSDYYGERGGTGESMRRGRPRSWDEEDGRSDGADYNEGGGFYGGDGDDGGSTESVGSWTKRAGWWAPSEYTSDGVEGDAVDVAGSEWTEPDGALTERGRDRSEEGAAEEINQWEQASLPEESDVDGGGSWTESDYDWPTNSVSELTGGFIFRQGSDESGEEDDILSSWAEERWDETAEEQQQQHEEEEEEEAQVEEEEEEEEARNGNVRGKEEAAARRGEEEEWGVAPGTRGAGGEFRKGRVTHSERADSAPVAEASGWSRQGWNRQDGGRRRGAGRRNRKRNGWRGNNGRRAGRRSNARGGGSGRGGGVKSGAGLRLQQGEKRGREMQTWSRARRLDVESKVSAGRAAAAAAAAGTATAASAAVGEGGRTAAPLRAASASGDASTTASAGPEAEAASGAATAVVESSGSGSGSSSSSNSSGGNLLVNPSFEQLQPDGLLPLGWTASGNLSVRCLPTTSTPTTITTGAATNSSSGSGRRRSSGGAPAAYAAALSFHVAAIQFVAAGESTTVVLQVKGGANATMHRHTAATPVPSLAFLLLGLSVPLTFHSLG
ncbi:unnamed protein product [Closterium sp. NIES-64]|nr:unnamed protein product [Closterium sp. NIES-64]